MPAEFSRTTRALRNDSPRFALVAWGVAGVFLAAWLAWFTLGRVTVYEVSRKARLEVKQAPHPVSSPVAGKLASSTLAIGTEVRAGDVLASLEAGAERLRLQEEEMKLASYPRRADALRKEIAALQEAVVADQRAVEAAMQAATARAREANVAVEFAQDTERRMREESAAGSVAQIDALRAASEARKLTAVREALTVDVRRLELDARTRAQQTTVQIEGLRRTLVSLEAEVPAVQASVERLRLEIDRRQVRAPIDGRIGEVVVLKPGAYVAEGQTLATVVPSGDLVIVAEFDPATALGRLQPGQRARLRLDGFPWAQYGMVEASVVRVASEIRESTLRVELGVIRDPRHAAFVQHGQPGSVEVGIETVAPAVLLLRAAGQVVSRQPARAAVATGPRS